MSEPKETASLRLRAATWDRETGLPCYSLLVDALRRHLETRRHIGVLHVELDQVESVENLYGWQAFDALASCLGEDLRASVGEELPPSTLLAVVRVPADRFVAFVPATHAGHEPDAAFLASTAAALSDRLDRSLGRDDLAAFAPRARVRIGLSLLSENPFYRFERRIHAAVDEARAHPDRRVADRDRVWRAELHRIIRDGAITVLFQPIVHLESREVIGYEALARGPLDTAFEAPRALFALGERFGGSSDLDRMCREAALDDSALDRVRGRIFVNTRPESLAEPIWRRSSRGEAGRDPFPASRVVVEVSERSIADDVARVAASRDALRDAGFGLSLDDVGTGYESLLTVERIRPDFVKVDPVLVRGIQDNLVQQELFSSLTEAARRVGAEVVAVGIESEEEAKTVRALGASLAQGFAFGRPAALSELVSPGGTTP